MIGNVPFKDFGLGGILGALAGKKKSTSSRPLAGASQEELRRGAATDALRSRFTRELEELPAAVARGASQAAAMGMRGRGRSMAGSAQSRQAMADAAMQGAQAKAEVTSQIQEAQKQTDAFSEADYPEGAQLCAKCNTTAVIMMDGCMTCLSCGDSKCG